MAWRTAFSAALPEAAMLEQPVLLFVSAPG